MLLSQQTPLWDEAIANLLAEQQEQLDVALELHHLEKMAVDNAVRLGDIIETLYLMAIYGDWQYNDAEGQQKELDEEALQAMYAKGRIDKSNAQAFNGLWTPTGFYPKS